jgi:cobalt-precorrin 5A hydrolase
MNTESLPMLDDQKPRIHKHIVSKMTHIAFWAITPKGACLADTLREKIGNVTLFTSNKTDHEFHHTIKFESFRKTLNDNFHQFDGHVFFMATGIVVRMISALIQHKTTDPAVVVMDEQGIHCISLLSGHIGGANELTRMLATFSGANPVITTATDLHQLPAIDVIASENDMFIENPDHIKTINMCILQHRPFWIYDPLRLIIKHLKDCVVKNVQSIQDGLLQRDENGNPMPGIIINEKIEKCSDAILILRPPTLAVGIGCNRNTKSSEFIDLFHSTMAEKRLAEGSVFQLASIDIKSNESGMINASKALNIPLCFFDVETLNTVKTIQNPSAIVRQHIGANSVCEAAAILATDQGKLIVPKQKTQNVTMAVAQKFCT